MIITFVMIVLLSIPTADGKKTVGFFIKISDVLYMSSLFGQKSGFQIVC